ncbi:hypothetical protein A2U01_0016169, partial [Trifolium medium]|nr:hypothetical protein [Trifolium medium]
GYPGADTSTTLTTTQGYRSYNFRVWTEEMQMKAMIPLSLSWLKYRLGPCGG